jgi:RIO-like serine/threonine protein kinase
MNDDELVSAVRRVEQRGFSLVPLEMVADEARWRGAGLEQELDRLATLGRLDRHKQPACDPAYASR